VSHVILLLDENLHKRLLTLIPWRFNISRGWIASGSHILGFIRLPAQLRQLDYSAAGGRGGYQFVVFIGDADTMESSSDAIMHHARSRSPPTQQNLGATQGNISTAAPPAKDFQRDLRPRSVFVRCPNCQHRLQEIQAQRLLIKGFPRSSDRLSSVLAANLWLSSRTHGTVTVWHLTADVSAIAHSLRTHRSAV
jgi:hypothetical protein